MWYFIFLDKENLSVKNLLLSAIFFYFFQFHSFITTSFLQIIQLLMPIFFKSAMNYRVGSFTDPLPFLKKLLRIEWVILIFFPHAYVFF